MKYKTVKDLIKELQKLPKNAILVRETQGYYQVLEGIKWFLIHKEVRKLTNTKKVKESKERIKQGYKTKIVVRSIGRKRITVSITGLE